MNKQLAKMNLTLDNDKLIFHFRYDPQLIARIKADIPGRRWNPAKRHWHCPATREAAFAAQALGFKPSDEVKKKFGEREAKRLTLPKHLQNTLYPFQVKGIDFLVERNGRALIGDEMRLGKTVQSLGYLAVNPEYRALIVCPASVKLNWRYETQRWLRTNSVEIINGTLLYPLNGSRVTIINYDILRYWTDKLMDFDVLILDEVHYCANSSKRTKACQRLAKYIPHRIGLSGTLLTNRPMELFLPINIVSPTLFPNRHQYGLEFCNAKQNGFGWDYGGASNTGKLNQVLNDSLMLRRTVEEVLPELPKKRRHVVPMEMGDNGAKIYHEAERDLISWLASFHQKKATTAIEAEALVKIEYLKRVAANAKYKNAIAWIRDMLTSGEKLVLFAVHKKMISRLMADLQEYNPVKVDGSVKGPKRFAAVKAFQTDEKCKVFVGNIKAAGVGLGLHAASITVFVELADAPGAHDQAESRVQNVKQQAGSIDAFYLLTENTIETELAELIDRKREVLTAVLDGKEVDSDSMLSELINVYHQK